MLLLLSRFSCVQLCATPETATHQAPPSMGFFRQEYWSGVPLPSPYLPYRVEVTHANTQIQHIRYFSKTGYLVVLGLPKRKINMKVQICF